MKPTRQSQPYRRSGSRAPSAVLDAMMAGRAAGDTRGMQRAAFAGRRAKAPDRKIRVPRVTPLHKRHPR